MRVSRSPELTGRATRWRLRGLRRRAGLAGAVCVLGVTGFASGAAGSFDFLEATGSANPFDGIDVGTLSKPALADLDGDGDADLAVGRGDGGVSYFENTGSATAPAFLERTGPASPLSGVQIGYDSSAPAFADLDADGDLDLTVGDGYHGRFHFFENTGDARSPAFASRSGSANPLGGFAVVVPLPAFGDLDGDGDLDLVSGQLETFAYFENVGDAAAPSFAERTGPASPVGGLDLGFDGPRAFPALGDLDRDADLDMLVGTGYCDVLAFENLGQPRTPGLRETPLLMGCPYVADVAPALVDLDADGDLDLILGGADGGLRFLAGGPSHPFFEPAVPPAAADPLFGLAEAAGRAFGDLDGDGDLDAVAAREDGTFSFLANLGSAADPGFRTRLGTADPLAGFDVGDDSSPALADLDGDGDLDLVSGSAAGSFAWLENTGTALAPTFVLRSGSADPLDGTDVGDDAWPALGDLDDDGDVDLVSGRLDGTFAWFENTGSPTAPAFAEQIGPLSPLFGVDVGASSRPALADLDADGDLDLFTDGTAFENTGGAATPAFVERSASTHPFALPGSGFPSLADLDGDGDLELSRSGASPPEPSGPAFWWNVTHDALEPRTGAANPFGARDVGARAAPALADWTGDGSPDAAVGRGDGTLASFVHSPHFGRLLELGGPNAPLAGFDLGDAAAPAWGDADRDGDPDLVVGRDDGSLAWLENTGTRVAAVLVLRTGTGSPLSGVDVGTRAAPSLGDLDADGDLDLLVGRGDGSLAYFENSGPGPAPAFALRTGTANPLAGVDVGEFAAPALGDRDGDGDLDLVVGRGDGTAAYFENTGAADAPAFLERTGAANPLDGRDVGSDARPAFADLDRDGDRDVFAGSLDGTVAHFANPAGLPRGFVPRLGVAGPFGNVDPAPSVYVRPGLADLDADGDLDLVLGNISTLQYFENTGNPALPLFAERVGTANPFDAFSFFFQRPHPAFVDLDADGDIDVCLGTRDRYIPFLENTGTATAPAFVQRLGAANPLYGFTVGVPDFGDLDGDGDFDVIAAGSSLGQVSGFVYLENTGTATAPAFAERTGPAHPLGGWYGQAPRLADVDGDGDLDVLALGSAFFENTGSPTAPAFARRVGSANPFAQVPNEFHAIADLDADGDLDVVSGGKYAVELFQNLAAESATGPPGLPLPRWSLLGAAAGLGAALLGLLRGRPRYSPRA